MKYEEGSFLGLSDLLSKLKDFDIDDKASYYNRIIDKITQNGIQYRETQENLLEFLKDRTIDGFNEFANLLVNWVKTYIEQASNRSDRMHYFEKFFESIYDLMEEGIVVYTETKSDAKDLISESLSSLANDMWIKLGSSEVPKKTLVNDRMKAFFGAIINKERIYKIQ